MNKLLALWVFACLLSLLWYVSWISYDIIVWNKLPFEVNFFNYLGAILSIFCLFAGFQFSTAKHSESEKIVQTMETEIKELQQALIRIQQEINAYKNERKILTKRITELEARLKDDRV